MSSFGAGILGLKKRTIIAIRDDFGQFLEFEATISVSHTATAQTTDHPVESDDQGNIDVTDHIRADPETVTINGVISNFPIVLFRTLRGQPSIGGGDPATRLEDAYKFLRGIKEDGKLVDVTTRLREYENMAIIGLSTTQDKDTSEILDITIDLREIRIATTQQTDAPEPTQASSAKKTNRGKKNKTPASANQSTRGQSLLTRLIGAF